MAAYQGIFKRVEKKYRLDAGQYRRLLARIGEFVQPDRFAESLIGNIYYDTPDSRLIRTSLEKPVYKEKLRLRCYGVPADDTPVFAELKKKYKGVVYKRRVRMPLNIAAAYLAGRCPPPDPGQITREIDWFRFRYPGLAPAMYLSYERSALCGRDDSGLRITFDRRILWRRDTLDLTAGSGGSPLLAPDERLMEIKCVGAMPLWLAEALSDLAIWPSTFSKYGNAYKESLLTADAAQALGGIDCA